MNADCTAPETKKKRHRGSESGHKNDAKDSSGESSGGLGHLPSKEAMASKGLEAKVDMATHGHRSWSLTNLGSWRSQSLPSPGDGGGSADFIKSRQREARRAMLGHGTSEALETGAGGVAPGDGGDGVVDGRSIAEAIPKKPPGGEKPSDMAVG
ncbi:unnamed protein product [Scytosiphon promiscuus]